MTRFAGYALTLSLCFAGSTAYAQSAMTELYGEGVHRYFAGDLLSAEQLLSRVIDSGQQDPRAYYFRGLTREQLGSAGQEDFEAAARIEAEGRRAFNVGFALSRIQGYTRAQIEQIRLDARVVAQQQAMQRERSRIEAGGEPRPPRIQPGPNTLPPADTVPPFDTVPPVDTMPPVDDFDPYADPAAMPPPTVDPDQPVAPESDALSNPFDDDPVPAPDTIPEDTPAGADDPFNSDVAPPADDDPFSSDAVPPADDAPMDSDAEAASELEDPFAEPGADEPAPADTDMEDDPFEEA